MGLFSFLFFSFLRLEIAEFSKNFKKKKKLKPVRVDTKKNGWKDNKKINTRMESKREKVYKTMSQRTTFPLSSSRCPIVKQNLLRDLVDQLKAELKTCNDQIRTLTVAQLLDQDLKHMQVERRNTGLSHEYKWDVDDIRVHLQQEAKTSTTPLLYYYNNDGTFLLDAAYNPRFLKDQMVALHFVSESESKHKEVTYWVSWGSGSHELKPLREDFDWITQSTDTQWYLLMLDKNEKCFKDKFQNRDKESLEKWTQYSDLGDMEKCPLTLIFQDDKNSILPGRVDVSS